jgi:hypothetical protein
MASVPAGSCFSPFATGLMPIALFSTSDCKVTQRQFLISESWLPLESAKFFAE